MCQAVKILCVDDEDFVLDSLQGVFPAEKYEFYAAKSGFAGLLLLSKTPGVQVIISDYRMPGMSGVEFLREVSALWPETLRIMISGASDPEVNTAIMRGEIYKFMLKPWNHNELRLLIATAVEIFNTAQEETYERFGCT